MTVLVRSRTDVSTARHDQPGRPGRAPGRIPAMILMSAALSACAVGPTYEKPALPAAAAYTREPLPAQIPSAANADDRKASAEPQTLHSGEQVKSQWWDEFHSPALSALVNQALAHSPDVAAAQATLEQARYAARAREGGLFPQAGASASESRIRDSGASSNGLMGQQLFSLQTGQVFVSYAPDAFGLVGQQAKAARAQAEVAREQLGAARLTIAGQVVRTTVNVASLKEAVRVLTENLEASRRIEALTRTSARLGAATQSDVLAQEKQALEIQSALSDQRKSLDQARHQLNIYLGIFPEESGIIKIPALSDLTLPAQLPLGLPSTLASARPDIRAAEAQLRAANARVGEATARLYPRIQITASFGQQSNEASDFFNPASRIWNLAGGLLMPLFEGGRLRAEKQASEAAYQADLARYRSTVLKAFVEVADTLRALQHDADKAQSRNEALLVAERSVALDRARYYSGAIEQTALLVSDMQYRSAQLAAATARAQRLTDTAALYLALGGGHPFTIGTPQPQPQTQAPQ